MVWIGESGWGQPEFIETLTIPVVATQTFIGFAGIGFDSTNPAWAFFSELWNSTQDTATFGVPEDIYHYSAYDLLVITALAVEQGGSYDASDWAPAVFEVVDGGNKCYTYADCLALIRAGTDIDYDGVTGPGTYTEGGVNAVTPVVFPYGADGATRVPIIIDPAAVPGDPEPDQDRSRRGLGLTPKGNGSTPVDRMRRRRRAQARRLRRLEPVRWPPGPLVA